MSEETQVVVRNQTLSVKEVADRVNTIHTILEKVMKQNTHYGTVPGCGNKMVLLKPGADLLAMTFRLVPQFAINRTELENGHREYDVTCSMYSPDGVLLGQGVGSASSMEKKYRYRTVDGKKIENEDIADVMNTVLKIAKKRAHIDATLTVTGAADIFTQDLIDEDSVPAKKREPPKMPKEKNATPTEPQTVTGTLEDISVKHSPESSAKKWVKYGLKINGEYYGTFDETIGQAAESMKGLAVIIEWKDDGKYKTALSIKTAEKDPYTE